MPSRPTSQVRSLLLLLVVIVVTTTHTLLSLPLSPPLTVEEEEIDSLRDKTRDALRSVFKSMRDCILDSAKADTELSKLRVILDEVMATPQGWQDDYYASNQLDLLAEDPTVIQVRRPEVGIEPL